MGDLYSSLSKSPIRAFEEFPTRRRERDENVTNPDMRTRSVRVI